MKFLRGLLLPLVVVGALVCFAMAVDGLSGGQSAERLAQMEDAVRRSCAACYATEGVYPPSIDYLRDRYGLQIDEEHYIVHYTVSAQNLMPDIMVLPSL